MKILFVCSGNSSGISPFIQEQAESIAREGIVVEFFLIEGKGIYGYLSNIYKFNTVINKFNPDLIHAHYGLSGLFANIQRKVAVVTTFHGSDINTRNIWVLSRLAMKFSKYNIFVSNRMANKAFVKKNYSVIPCGIDLNIFFQMDKNEARKKSNLKKNDKIVLFSGAFHNKIKNYSLAKSAIDLLDDNIKLIELTGYNREQVNLLLNSSDVALMTSLAEGSPQFIKEAMACNCPIVSTDVGDVKEIIGKTDGCYICSYDASDIAGNIGKALYHKKRTNGWGTIKNLEQKKIAHKIIDVYFRVLDNNTELSEKDYQRKI